MAQIALKVGDIGVNTYKRFSVPIKSSLFLALIMASYKSLSLGIGMALALVLFSMLLARSAAQSGCISVLLGMSPCLNYITRSSSTPSSSCCSQLASVVKSQPQCLCTALNGGGAALGITINRTHALALPGACNVQTPPISRCNAAKGPASFSVASPIGSPGGVPGTSSNEPSNSSTSSSEPGAGSITFPTTGASSSNGAVVEMPLQLVLLFIFMAAYSSLCCSF
ncbi:hypothetical protein F2P56_027526 [Juglans regia]|uniref:Non-specific lipid-transfer protein-like protein At2g13820 n=2 Tax=Juglans regia TaxID=51240 RepID=A0A2I4G962_JUGRE|nr:non-specific lipid-transfer protein-like protein At2g13820 [Juglans regia]XP_018840438.1 non-specific lipid-transfer protein-like protein At2g13820 [Juglans regia]KAF5452546.1 hypothetical protein F2P56_027526 [Juglans regia]